MMNYIMNIYY